MKNSQKFKIQNGHQAAILGPIITPMALSESRNQSCLMIYYKQKSPFAMFLKYGCKVLYTVSRIGVGCTLSFGKRFAIMPQWGSTLIII